MTPFVTAVAPRTSEVIENSHNVFEGEICYKMEYYTLS